MTYHNRLKKIVLATTRFIHRSRSY